MGGKVQMTQKLKETNHKGDRWHLQEGTHSTLTLRQSSLRIVLSSVLAQHARRRYEILSIYDKLHFVGRGEKET